MTLPMAIHIYIIFVYLCICVSIDKSQRSWIAALPEAASDHDLADGHCHAMLTMHAHQPSPLYCGGKKVEMTTAQCFPSKELESRGGLLKTSKMGRTDQVVTYEKCKWAKCARRGPDLTMTGITYKKYKTQTQELLVLNSSGSLTNTNLRTNANSQNENCLPCKYGSDA